MIQLITQWLMANLNMIGSVIVAIPMVSAFGIAIVFIIDERCADYKWYRTIMYGGEEKDQRMADVFFGKMFVTLGVANIIVPCIVIYGYLYYSNITLTQFVRGQTGG